MASKSKIADILKKNATPLLNDWLKAQTSAASLRRDLMREDELRNQSEDVLHRITAATQSGDFERLDNDSWQDVRDLLERIAASRATQGFSSSETATFILSLKQPLFSSLRAAWGNDGDSLFGDIWAATTMIDKLALVTTEATLKAREDLIARQQADMLELSTPVVKLWDGILALPMIGTLDSARTQVVMESLLQRIVETGSQIAILDITGVPTVDTLVAQHLIKTVAAARLMGADCIISGIRPQIAQTMVHLAIDLSDIITKATLADAFVTALQKIGATVAGRGGNGARSAKATSATEPVRR